MKDEVSVKANIALAEEACFSTIVLGELYFGAARSGKPSENAERIDALAASWPVIVIDLAIARLYGQIKHRLYSKGRPLPENDMWIAATALRHNLELVTRDRHFAEIEGLSISTW